MLGLSWLMVSDVRYPSFKTIDFKTRGTFTAIIGAVVFGVIAIRFRYIVPVVLFSAYLLYGFVRPWISQRMRREIEEFSDSTDGDNDPADNEKIL